MSKTFEVTKMTVFAVKAFIKYMIFYQKNENRSLTLWQDGR